MRGHEAITRLRLANILPSEVFVFVLADRDPATGIADPEDSIANGFFPEVEIGPSEVVGLLDLRFLRGVRVHVIGEAEARVRAVARRATHFHPSTVVACWGDTPIIWSKK